MPAALVPIQDTRFNGNVPSASFCRVTFVPLNGNDVLTLPWQTLQGIPAAGIQAEFMKIHIEALGPSVTNAKWVSLAPDKNSITINFTQTGGDAVEVTVINWHSIVAGF